MYAPAQLPEVNVDGQSGAAAKEDGQVSPADPALEVHLQQTLLAAYKAQSAIDINLGGSNYVHEAIWFRLNRCRGAVTLDVHCATQASACSV